MSIEAPFILAATYALTEVLSLYWPQGAARKLLPLVAVALAVMLTSLSALWLGGGLTLESWAQGVVTGFVAVFVHAVRKAGGKGETH